MPLNLRNSFTAPEQLLRSGPERCHSTQFNNCNIARSISSYSVPCTTYHWHVTRVLTPLLLELERLNGFGPDGFCSARTDNSNYYIILFYNLLYNFYYIIMWSTAICIVPRDTCLCHLARDLTNLLLAVERLIRFEPDRRRSTQANDGEVVSIYVS